MMKLKQTGALALTALIAVIGFASVGQAADGQSVYFQSNDFPFDVFVQKPVPPEENTRFYQLLDQAFKQNNLVLSNQKETANYWATLHCSGLFNCAELQLDVTTADRVVLASIRMPGKKYPWSKPDLEGTATEVAKALQNRIDALPDGGTGTYDIRGFRH